MPPSVISSGMFPDATFPKSPLKRTNSRQSNVQYSYSTKSRVITQARTKLYHEASKNDIDLRLLVCHANLLDYLVADLAKNADANVDSDTSSPNYTLTLPPTYESDESDDDDEDEDKATYYDDDEHLISKDNDDEFDLHSSTDSYSYYDYSDDECDSETEDESQVDQAFLDKCDKYFHNSFSKRQSKSTSSRDVDIDCHADDEDASSDDGDYDSDSDSYYDRSVSNDSDESDGDESDSGDLGLHRCNSRSAHNNAWAPQVTVVDVCDSESESEVEETVNNNKSKVAVHPSLHNLGEELMIGYNFKENDDSNNNNQRSEADSWGMSSYEDTVKSEIRRTIELMDRLHQSRRQNRAHEDFNETALPGLIKTDFSTSEEDSDDSDPLVTPTSSSEVSDDNSSTTLPGKLGGKHVSFHFDIDESNNIPAGSDNTSWSQIEV